MYVISVAAELAAWSVITQPRGCMARAFNELLWLACFANRSHIRCRRDGLCGVDGRQPMKLTGVCMYVCFGPQTPSHYDQAQASSLWRPPAYFSPPQTSSHR